MGNYSSKKLPPLFRTPSPNSSRRRREEAETADPEESNQSQSLPIIPIKAAVIDGWKAHHDLLKEHWGENFIAPVDEWLKIGGFKVLDMGCGTGTWLNEVALEYPHTEFIGVDVLSLLGQRYLKNIKFVQADIKLTLPFNDDTFDYIHMRHMILHFTYQEYTTIVVPELIRVLKPGGFIEITESDMEWRNLSQTGQTLVSGVHRSMRLKGVDPFMINHLNDILISTEKLDTIYHRVRDAQVGYWAGRKGEILLGMCEKLFNNIRVLEREALKISDAEFDGLIQQFKDDVETHKTYCQSHKFYAAKRLD